ncbi:MAG: ABC transporter substrate-binding protein [Chloroflexia bacterium]
MTKAKRFSPILALLLLATAVLQACGSSSEATSTPAPGGGTTPAAQAETTPTEQQAGATPQANQPTRPPGVAEKLTRLGLVLVTSGDNAVYGKSQRQAAEMAWKEIDAAGGINGAKIAAIFEDSVSKPDRAVTAFQKLINTDDVLAIIGPTLSNEALSADPEAQKAKVPVLGISNTASGITDIGDFIFRDSLAESQVIPETVKQAKDKLGIAKVSILYAKDDAFSKSGYDVFKSELQKNNIQILSEQTFSTNDTDFKPQLTAIKGENPDAIVVSALAKPAQTILQQARGEVGIDTKIHIIGGNGFNSPAVLKAAGAAAEGLVVGAAWNSAASDDLNKKFIDAYKAKYGSVPDQFAAQSYAGFYILADAIKRANLTDLTPKALTQNRLKVRDALKTTKDFPTVLGNFSFTDKRDANHPPVVQIVKSGKFEVLK